MSSETPRRAPRVWPGGLRVLLLMHKACTGGVSLYGETETVGEILEQTGFDSIFH